MVKAQQKHVFYDTVKTVKERIDFSPDTIPVYFKELIIGEPITEHWVKGYLIWQTYKKAGYGINAFPQSSTWSTVSDLQSYYKDDYSYFNEPQGIFLYEDRKTKVKKHVLIVFKR